MRVVHLAAVAGGMIGLTLAASSLLGAQNSPTISAGNRVVNGSGLPVGSDTTRVLLSRNGTETQIGTLVDRLVDTVVAGQRALLRVLIQDDGAQRSIDSLLVLRSTMAPVWHRSVSTRQAVALEYSGTRVHGTVTPKDSAAHRVDLVLPAPAFAAFTADLVVATLPLAAGYEARVAAYDVTKGFRWVEAKVAGMETIAGCEVWAVNIEDAGLKMTWFIDRRTRAQVGARLAMPDGGTLTIIP